MDLSLIVTLGVIFLLTLFAAYLRTQVKDRCLKSFDGFHVTVELANGKLVWGTMSLEATGLELVYQDALQDEKHIESSYVLYGSEYQNIQAIYRYAERLTEWGQKRRARDIRRSFHPSLLRRLGRSLRNFLGTATDSLNDAFGLLLGRIQKVGGRYLAEDSTSSLSRLGGQMLGTVGGIFDPLLERYIGQRVVFEIMEGTEIHEHVGVFMDYSPDLLEFLDVCYPQRQILPIALNDEAHSDLLDVQVEAGIIRAHNRGEYPLLLQTLRMGDQEQLLNVVVDGDETVELHVPVAWEKAELHLQVVRELDIIVPRTRCVVRHRAEHYRPEALREAVVDIIFDLGVAFTADRHRTSREQQLREQLAHNPKDALAAANLAALLIQSEDYTEAEQWLQVALAAEHSLPDGGKRARMQWRELMRRRTEMSVLRQTQQESLPVPTGTLCVVCNAPIRGQGKMLGGRCYCERHYAEAVSGRRGTWQATAGLIVGLAAFVLVVSLLSPVIGPLLSGLQLVMAGLLLALVPAAIWLAIFYVQDRLEPEPKRYVLGVFLLGAVLAAVIGQPVVNGFFRTTAWTDGQLWTRLAADILLVGALQAFLIYAAVRYTIFRSDEFDEPVDGIIYGAAAGLGYAAMLNIQYVVGHGGVDLGAGAFRVAITALAYASFGGILGHFLAQAKLGDRGPFWLPAGVALTAALNGIVVTAFDVAIRTGLRVTPVRGLLLAAVIALVTFALLFFLMRRGTAAALSTVST